MMATTASPKSHVRAHSAGATPTVNVPGRRGGTGVGPVAVWEFRGVTVVWLITTVLSPMCMSCRPGECSGPARRHRRRPGGGLGISLRDRGLANHDRVVAHVHVVPPW